MIEAKIKLKRMEAAAPMMFSLLVEYRDWTQEADFTFYGEDYGDRETMDWLNQQTTTLIDMVNCGFEEDESAGKEQEEQK